MRGLLLRQAVPGDRRKTQLVCTEKAGSIIETDRELQKIFAQKLLAGMSDADIKVFHNFLTNLSNNIENIRTSGVSSKE